MTSQQPKKKIIFKVSLPQGGISLRDAGELFASIGTKELHEKYDVVISCAAFGEGANESVKPLAVEHDENWRD